MQNLTFGRYIPSNSPVHKVDPRIKIISSILLFGFIFSAKNLLALIFVFLALLGVVLLSSIKLSKFLKSLKFIIILAFITNFINFIFEIFALHKNIFDIEYYIVLNSCITLLKLISLIFISSVIMYTTSPTGISSAISSLLLPFKYLGLNTEEIAITITISIRFLPILLLEAKNIALIQKSRGVSFDGKNIFLKAKTLFFISVPIFVLSLKKAHELAAAMESRCYNVNSPRTKYKILKFKQEDLVAIIYIFVIILGVVICNKIKI
ncbi:MAG: energy-coupling factor transporter transmembrane protein EcfT [Clostridia bacterium]|nr:energy-coupling factor transporter transmembrane protein EcfT [Clostridia bacterium]